MDVHLHVYDLSQGMARAMSMPLLGIQLDAVYHTSIVIDGIEYFFGQGIQTCAVGTSHHKNTIEVIKLGTTQLDMPVILQFLDSLKPRYTAEAYDLFTHNCNNFSHDFAMLVVGSGIPSKITSLPQTVLQTPLGQMFKQRLDQMMRPITQAPLPSSSNTSGGQSQARPAKTGTVHLVSSGAQLSRLLDSAASSCAVIFFTSSTCAPCRMAYPEYDKLATEAGDRATLIKVDINVADRAAIDPYAIQATPTFISLLNGQQLDRWTGAHPGRLRTQVEQLMAMATPVHKHRLLNIPVLSRFGARTTQYSTVPDLDKLTAKLAGTGVEADPGLKNIVAFLQRSNNGLVKRDSIAKEADMVSFFALLDKSIDRVPASKIFAVYDLLRLVVLNDSASKFICSDNVRMQVVEKLLQHVETMEDAPYGLRLVCLQLGCNLLEPRSRLTAKLFSYRPHQATDKQPSVIASLASLAIPALVDDQKSNLRLAGARCLFNLAAVHHNERARSNSNSQPAGSAGKQNHDNLTLPGSVMADMAVAAHEAIEQEQTRQAEGGPLSIQMAALVSVIGLVIYGVQLDDPEEKDMYDTVIGLQVRQTVSKVKAAVAKLSADGQTGEMGRGEMTSLLTEIEKLLAAEIE